MLLAWKLFIVSEDPKFTKQTIGDHYENVPIKKPDQTLKSHSCSWTRKNNPKEFVALKKSIFLSVYAVSYTSPEENMICKNQYMLKKWKIKCDIQLNTKQATVMQDHFSWGVAWWSSQLLHCVTCKCILTAPQKLTAGFGRSHHMFIMS